MLAQVATIRQNFLIVADFISKASRSDFESLSSTLTFSSGSSVGATKCANISIIDDDVFEGNQYFSLQLATRNPHVMVGTAVTRVTITDYDGKYWKLVLLCLNDRTFAADVSVSLPTVLMVAEGDEMVDVCATLTAKRMEKAITIRLLTSKNDDDKLRF